LRADAGWELVVTRQETVTKKPSLWKRLWFQVFVAIFVGIVLGAVWPAAGTAMKPFGDGFIALIKMMIAPIIFCTIVHGIGSMRDLGRVGRIGFKALIYFEVISTIALMVGMAVAHLVQPGVGFEMAPTDTKAVQSFVQRAQEGPGVMGHILAIIPQSFFDAFATGDLLQVLLISTLTGVALAKMGSLGHRIATGIEHVGQVFFRIVGFIVYVAPIGAFGAIAYTVGAFGVRSLVSLGYLIAVFFLTITVFTFLLVGPLAHLAGFSFLKFLKYIREEIVIAFATSSSETVLPSLMRKLERLGVSEAVVGLVVPTGYSFNLCGTNIYMTLAIIFLAQVSNTHLTLTQEITVLAITMLTSKGAAGVAGAGFVVLAATLTMVPDIPIESLGLLLGIDRFMSIGRTLTNFVGNGAAAIIIARWEGEVDRHKMVEILSGRKAMTDPVSNMAA
jgi:aerobic C4-dicarboxylate transport protein